MSGNKIILDTNQIIFILNNSGDISWLKKYDIVYLPVIVIGELLFGALNSKNKDKNLEKLDKIIQKCTILNVTHLTSQIYAKIRLSLKKKGKPIPENDLWIAAICIEHNLPLLTADNHFREIEELKMVTV
ncbi:MAG: type II toxin-antitoxin system VapC family toxin [Spirochaetales bacterium]|nr:type II toxin-antitoxin system VapC family toxin [Spirochaetales bacterium]